MRWISKVDNEATNGDPIGDQRYENRWKPHHFWKEMLLRFLERILGVEGFPRSVTISILVSSLVLVNMNMLTNTLPLVLNLQHIQQGTGIVMAAFAFSSILGSFLAAAQVRHYGSARRSKRAGCFCLVYFDQHRQCGRFLDRWIHWSGYGLFRLDLA
ncbi:hypothetical protein [Seinonella peptonophila]|uniref:hypothetical protein n=1 Tax=Seinonella peptonophila TaxID=112248 RepID=UPI001114EC7E|nr:hypothetical protein [Seinonella peptonophila]